ncbi:MAG: hypothetical protein JXB10_03555 [Pirellulales bacterium]|nr:hypothetical protein [Pirellulales bacterium]
MASGGDVGLALASDVEDSMPDPVLSLPQPRQTPVETSPAPLKPSRTAGYDSCGASCASALSCGDAGCSGWAFTDWFGWFDWIGPPASCHHSKNLYDAPCLFGGPYSPLTSVGALSGTERYEVGYCDLPLAGGAGRMNVADNNKPLTEDRVFFLYNHFHQNLMARQWDSLDPYTDNPLDFSVDRYTVGFEKAFLDHLWSVDVRLPLAGQFHYAVSPFEVGGEVVGNLGIIFKRMIYESNNTAVAAGVGVEVPTGSDVTGSMADTLFRMKNEAVHLTPFAGILQTRNRLFMQAFLSVDVPLNGNTIAYDDPQFGIGEWGVYTEQTLLRVDAACGYWLYRNGCSPYLTGLAFVGELHYLSTLNDTDAIYGDGTGTSFIFLNYGDRVDYFDFTVGLHADLANHMACRVGAAFPFRDRHDRTYTAEIIAQIERRF